MKAGVLACFSNSGQSCDAPTRMLVPADRHERSAGDRQGRRRRRSRSAIRARRASISARSSAGCSSTRSSASSGRHRRKARGWSRAASGGPRDLDRGYYVKPDRVRRRDAGHDDRARGDLRPRAGDPALRRRGRGDRDRQRHRLRPRRLRLLARHRPCPRKSPRGCAPARSTSTIPPGTSTRPFGGYKQSGNGREYADFGIRDYLEVKAVVGYGEA